MFSKSDTSQPGDNKAPSQFMLPAPKSRKRLYALGGIVAIFLIASALFVTQGFGETIKLNLNYTVGETMVYLTTTTVTNQLTNTSIKIAAPPQSQIYNSTGNYEIAGFDGENYKVNLTITSQINSKPISVPIMINVSKAEVYDNFLPASSPAFFYNITDNPTIESFLSKTEVKVGDAWQFPVKTGNASLGLTGELTLKFSSIQELTVPAGNYKVFVIEVSSSNLVMHVSPDNGVIGGSTLDGLSLQMNGRTYLEVGTCRLIQSELTQETSGHDSGVSRTSSFYCEKTLMVHTKP